MNSLIENLLQHGPVLTDGAWGTQLQARGLTTGEFPDGWNLTQPAKVAEVARAYVDAGSQVILTNTFGANRVRLAEEKSLAGHVREINRQGVEISKTAAGKSARVFASLGPTGKMLMTGEVTAEELQTAFEEQARALAEAGADVIGANCGQGIESFVGLCQRLRAASKLPVWIKANAGLPELVEGRPVYKTTPEAFAKFAPALAVAGASFIGGCCGTSPEFIKAVALELKKLRK